MFKSNKMLHVIYGMLHTRLGEYHLGCTLYFMVKKLPLPIPSSANAWMRGHFSTMNMSNLCMCPETVKNWVSIENIISRYMMQCNVIVSVNNQELETWEWNMATFTLRAVRDANTVAVLHHGDKTGDFEFLRCLFVLILGAHEGK